MDRLSGGRSEDSFDVDDLELPADIAKREFNEAMRSSANELRRKFPDFDTLPNGAQRALLDMEFNMGIKFHDGSNKKLPGVGWPNLFEAVRTQDWRRAAEESHRKTEGSPGMVRRNENTKRKFLEAFEGN